MCIVSTNINKKLKSTAKSPSFMKIHTRCTTHSTHLNVNIESWKDKREHETEKS